MREIALDTETTGLSPESGHRIIEIGCVEMHGRVRTGKTFQAYLNPDRDMPEEAYRIHGLSIEFLSDKPRFGDVVHQFLEFIGEAPLVIHNAQFDMGFINHELKKHGVPPLEFSRAIDTVGIARRQFPGAPAKLDALCKRFNIDLSARTKHGALLDAELLADVYLELMGGRQAALILAQDSAITESLAATEGKRILAARAFPPSAEELAAHEAFLTLLKNPLWLAA